MARSASALTAAIEYRAADKIVFYRAPSIFATMRLVAEFLAPNGAGGLPAGNTSVRSDCVRRARGEGRSDWAFGGYKDLATWTAAITDGDAEGAARVARFAADISPALAAPVGARRTMRRGAQGDELCIHRVYAGASRPWTYRARDLGRAPAPVTIIVPMTSNAHVGASAFAYRAAAALALAAPLQRAGYRVNIVAVDCTAGTFTRDGRISLFVAHDIQVGASLDVPRLSACLSVPHLRHLTFAIAAAAPLAIESGLGYAVQGASEITRLAAACGVLRPGAEAIIVSGSIESEGEAREWLKAESARFAPAAT